MRHCNLAARLYVAIVLLVAHFSCILAAQLGYFELLCRKI